MLTWCTPSAPLSPVSSSEPAPVQAEKPPEGQTPLHLPAQLTCTGVWVCREGAAGGAEGGTTNSEAQPIPGDSVP